MTMQAQSTISSMDQWRAQWMLARDNPDGFWLDVARRLEWEKMPTQGLWGSFDGMRKGPLSWFADGRLNITVSCLDRHARATPDKTAILWEQDEPGHETPLSYAQLLSEVCRVANVLRARGIGKGDRVILYMGMVPAAAVAMLACARVGAVHSVVFGGFSAQALRDRVRDCGAEMVITQDVGKRGGKDVPLKQVVDEALQGEPGVRTVLVYQRDATHDTPWDQTRDVWWHEATSSVPDTCEPEMCDAEDPLFILYTSGSTGTPKGVVHTCGGYLTYAAYTHQLVFGWSPDDVYGCMADVGWITGHSYIVYGPLANGATTVMFESTPLYPDAGRYWETIERLKISIFYTAPTAIRALSAKGDAFVHRHDLSSLRILGTVGEPINPEAWQWYHDVVGQGRCAVVDTWWQTETGGICLTPITDVTPREPGAATLPLPGHHPVIMDEHGKEAHGPATGHLCLARPWPGQARTVWRDHARFVATYFSAYPGYYFTGDGCRRDAHGSHWITGRVDDVLNVSGHRMGTAEFESAILVLDEVAEAAIVGVPHAIKGQGVFAFLVLQGDQTPDDALVVAIQATLRQTIGAHARIDGLQFVNGLPKTRSGKVMRRILRKIACGEADALGDISTLAEPAVVQRIVSGTPWGA